MLEPLAKKFSPKVVAALAFPALLIVSMPFAFISGAFSIILTDNVTVAWGVGIVIAVIFASWAAVGTYKLSNEVQEEKTADAVSV